MFSTLKERLLLGVYVFLVLSIPVGAYLASQTQNVKSNASEGGNTSESSSILNTQNTPRPTLSPAERLLEDSEFKALSESSFDSPTSSSPTVATSFGPTLSLKVTSEGRPAANQATKLFVGIIEGSALTSNPKFLLSFSVDLPANGTSSNLSLAGLPPGVQYTALLKGAAQIAASTSFVMSPAVTNLNDGQPINMISGDLNDDNVINSVDYSIVQKISGATSNSSNWNENADLNKDGIINVFDLSIVTKNIGQVGASGAWTSPIPQGGTPSASLTQPAVGSAAGETPSGYWMWIPK